MNTNTRRTATATITGTTLIGKSRQGTIHLVYGHDGSWGRAYCNRRTQCTANTHDCSKPITGIICESCFGQQPWSIA